MGSVTCSRRGRTERAFARASGQEPSELHLRRLLDRLALLGAHVEELLRLEPERAGEQRGRKLLDAGIVLLHRVVEEAARGGDLVLEIAQLALQLLEALVGLEVGIGLAEREQLAKRAAQRVLGGGLGGDPAGLRGNGGVARLDHRLQRAALMPGITL